MKYLKLIIVAIVLPLLMSAQGKRIQGELFLKTYILGFDNDTIIPCKKFKVYLLKTNEYNADGKIIFKSKNSLFDFMISEKKLSKYNYLEFTDGDRFIIVRIDSFISGNLVMKEWATINIAKPAIYLYSPTKKAFKITLKFKGQLGTTYPKYDNGWKVTTDSTGRMLNEKDNRKYSYLFWDGTCNFEAKHFDYKNGFYVNRFEYSSFLEEKLKLIGLKEQEINDFVVYWLPIMNKYPICFVHFWINDNIDQTAFIETSPKTNSQIRVFMEFKGYTDITTAPALSEQKLTPIKRKGITLVEWGGSEIGSKKLQ